MRRLSKSALTIVAAIVMVAAGFISAVAFAEEGQTTTSSTPLIASATGERATFQTAANVRSAWTQLAGGNRDNVKAIRQYPGDELPEGVTTRIVSTADSETPIYSWFDNGTIYYWSEDTHPFVNPNASYMFNGFTKATVIDVAPFDTSKVTDMEAMFANCDSVKVLDVRGFDTTNVRCMYCMFYNCKSLTELDLSHFNTTNTTAASDDNYGSLCGMFMNCSSLTELDLSSFDMTRTNWPYHTQNMFPGCTSLKKLTLGPKNWFNSLAALSGSWTHESNGLTLSGSALCSQYTTTNAFSLSGTWIRNMPEGHYYRTDGSLGETNLWEVHTPNDRFKGYCLNLNKYGVGEELDRVLAEDDSAIVELLCTASEGSVHGSEPLGPTMREALITLIYYGWPNDAAGIQQRYGLSDQEYLDITQNAVWDFTDRYDNPAGPTHYEGNALEAYNDLVSQRFENIEGNYILFLYKSWDPSKQNLLSIQGVDDQEYGGVEVRKQSENGADNLSGAEFTVFDASGKAVGTMTSSVNGTAYICRTDHSEGLPLGSYTVRETKPPAGYKLSSVEYHFTITEANEIVSIGWRHDPVTGGDIEEEMIFYDKHDDTYVGGGIGVMKKSNTSKMLVGAEFTIYDESGAEVATLVTNNSGVASTGKQDLPLGTYTVRETKAPEGHTISGDAQTVTIERNLQFITLTFQDNEKHGSIELEVQKVLEGEGSALKGGEFTFQLLDAQGNELQIATNDAEGNVAFDPIEYTPDDLGYKNYHIVEVVGDDESIRYDRHQEDVTVTIYDAGGSTLECAAVYDADGAVFTNRYGSKSYDVKLLKKKFGTDDVVEGAQLEVRDTANRLIGSWTSGDEAHVIKLEPGTYVLRETSAPQGYYVISDTKFTVTEDGKLTSGSEYVAVDGLSMTVFDKSISSTELEIEKIDGETGEALEGAEFTLESNDGEYTSVVVTNARGTARFEGLETGTYTLTETAPPEGYLAEGGPWTVEVKCERAISTTTNVNANGVASGDYPNNAFNRDTVRIGGSPESIHVVIKYQTEDGYDYLRLRDRDGNYITQDKDGNPIGDTRANYKGYIWGGLDAEAIRTLSFDLALDEVTFEFRSDQYVGAYGYHAVVSTDPLVAITDSAGQVVEPERGVFTFENKKLPTASVTFGGTKTLEGRDLVAGEFEFELTGSDDVKLTAKNAADGSYEFEKLTFSKPGEYAYEIREVDGGLPGVKYDPKVYSVTVTVTKDAEGRLVANVSGDSATGLDLDFANKYEAEATSVVLGGTKNLEGRKLVEGEFLFELTGNDGIKLQARNAADGSYAFDKLTYSETGTFHYEVREIAGSAPGIAYDPRVYKVTVAVADDGKGKLVATVSGDSKTGSDLNFTNKYEKSTIGVVLGGKKTLEGRALKAGEFTFELSGSDGAKTTATNAADGSYAFEEIPFSEAGMFSYEVREIDNGLKGVTYDSKVYSVTVTVTDDDKGGLTATVSGDTETGIDLDFTNTYKAATTSIIFGGKKTLEGRALAAGEFTFELTGTDGIKFRAKNNADGSYAFEELKYSEPGEYSYKVREIAGSVAGITYDSKVYEMTVIVTDVGQGKLAASVSGDSKTGTDLNFKNTYAKKAVSKSNGPATGDRGLPVAIALLATTIASGVIAVVAARCCKRA